VYFFTATLCASKSVGLWFRADRTHLEQMFSIKKY